LENPVMKSSAEVFSLEAKLLDIHPIGSIWPRRNYYQVEIVTPLPKSML
jgi:hypothetical protein